MLKTMPIEGTYAHLDQGLAAAQAAREEAGPDAALRVFALLRDQYPDALIVTFQASRMLCDAGRWDDAEAWLSEAIERFPGNLGLASEYARSAQRRHDFSEAARRWQTVCDEFPDNPTGFIGLVSVLRESEQFAAAESVVTTALEQFPDLPGLQVEHGLVAFARRDWATAAERWEILRTSQPEQRLGYLLGAQSLRNCGKMDEADALLAAGIEHFPDAAEMPVEFARMAHARRDWASAVDRWETARERFPDQIACYTGEALALRELGRFDEAEALLDAAVTRFPDQPGPRIEFAGLAQHRRDWQEAARRWAAVREFSPDSPIGYQAGATALRLAGLTEEAETLLTDAVTRFPDHAGILMEYASTAQAQLDWVAATQRWEHLRQIAPGNQTAYAAGAHALRQAGRDQEAEALMEMAIQRFPDDLGLRTSHAWAATHRKDWPEAIDRWNHVLTLQPDNPAGHLGMGRTFRVARRLDEAEAFLEKSMARLPDDAALACEYARVAAARADWDAAQERWELVRTRFPRHPTGYIGLAGVLRDRGEMDAAEQVIEAAIELLPDESGPLVEHAGLAIRRRDWDLAIDRWAKVRERFPDQIACYTGEALALRELGRFDEAEALLDAAVTRFPDQPGPRIEFAGLAQHRRDWQEAARRWAAVREFSPDSPIGYQAGATALRLAGLTEEAETLLTDAVTRFPDHAGILMEYASTAQAQLDWVAATQRWEHLRQIAPGNQTAYAAGAHALRQAGRDQEAEALMEMAIQRFPDDLGLRTSHAWAATHRKDWPEAIDRWNHVLTLQPDNPAGHLGMGRTFRVARRLDEAEAFLEKSMARLPDDAALACEYARVAAARADWDAAQERWELVRTRFPRHPTGYIGLAGVLRDRGEMDAAEQVIEAAIELLPDESGPLVEHAGLAIRRRDWDLAIDRWAKVRERFPHEPEGYAGGAVAMRELRQFDAAETLLEHAIRRFPAAPRPFLEYATVATRRGDWSVAVQRLKEARRYFPGNATIQSALHEAELRVAGDDTEPGAADTLQAEPALAPDPNGAIREVVSAFASLGGDQRGWEFGEMQQCYGTEPLDLLRWTSSQPAGLLAASQ